MRGGTNVVLKDLWKANFSTCYSTVIKSADTHARVIEAQSEAVLMHLYYGIVVSAAACAATLEIGSSKLPGAVETVRSRVLDQLGANHPAPEECETAQRGRNQLYGELLVNVRTRFTNVERTAYGIFQARGEVHGCDLGDWFAATDVALP